jgi:hypothetical protein
LFLLLRPGSPSGGTPGNVLGSGATGAQVASIFHAFGSRVQLFEAGPRIVASEDEDVSAAVAAAFRASGMVVRENFGAIESFERTPAGVRMNFSSDGHRDSAEAALAVAAVRWVANTAGLNSESGLAPCPERKTVRVDVERHGCNSCRRKIIYRNALRYLHDDRRVVGSGGRSCPPVHMIPPMPSTENMENAT